MQSLGHSLWQRHPGDVLPARQLFHKEQAQGRAATVTALRRLTLDARLGLQASPMTYLPFSLHSLTATDGAPGPGRAFSPVRRNEEARLESPLQHLLTVALNPLLNLHEPQFAHLQKGTIFSMSRVAPEIEGDNKILYVKRLTICFIQLRNSVNTCPLALFPEVAQSTVPACV